LVQLATNSTDADVYCVVGLRPLSHDGCANQSEVMEFSAIVNQWQLQREIAKDGIMHLGDYLELRVVVLGPLFACVKGNSPDNLRPRKVDRYL